MNVKYVEKTSLIVYGLCVIKIMKLTMGLLTSTQFHTLHGVHKEIIVKAESQGYIDY